MHHFISHRNGKIQNRPGGLARSPQRARGGKRDPLRSEDWFPHLRAEKKTPPATLQQFDFTRPGLGEDEKSLGDSLVTIQKPRCRTPHSVAGDFSLGSVGIDDANRHSRRPRGRPRPEAPVSRLTMNHARPPGTLAAASQDEAVCAYAKMAIADGPCQGAGAARWNEPGLHQQEIVAMSLCFTKRDRAWQGLIL